MNISVNNNNSSLRQNLSRIIYLFTELASLTNLIRKHYPHPALQKPLKQNKTTTENSNA